MTIDRLASMVEKGFQQTNSKMDKGFRDINDRLSKVEIRLAKMGRNSHGKP